MKNSPTKAASSPPAWPAAVAAAAGALCAAVWACGAAPWYAALGMLLAVSVVSGTRRAAAAMIAATLVALSAVRQSSGAADFGDRALYGTATVCADDPGVSALPELSGSRRALPVRLIAFAADSGELPKPGPAARVLLILPPGAKLPVCGTILRVTGRLIPAVAAGNGGPRRSDRPRDLLAADRIEAAGRIATRRGFFAGLRDRMLTALFAQVEDPETRRLAAALFCGVSYGVPRELRGSFSAAGMIHLFSVSGMHIAVLALTLGVVLRFLPFRVRYPVLAAAVWLYILVTGAGTPALRAGVMVTLWCALRMLLLKLPGFDLLCWTLVLLLAGDPFLAASPGAQYSFLITGALLLLAARRRRSPAQSETDCIPIPFRPRHLGWSERLARLPGRLLPGALAAFLAAAGISLTLASARIAPGAILANVLIAALLPGYFALFFIQLGAGLCGCGQITAPLFEGAFTLLRTVAETTARHSPAFVGPAPPWPAAAAYSLALLIFLGARDRRIRIAAGAFAALGVGCWLFMARSAPPAVLVISPGYRRAAAVAVADTAGRRAVLVNCPDRDAAASAEEFFRARGLAEIDVLGDAGGIRGLGALGLPVRRLREHRENAAALRRAPGGAPTAESARLHRDVYTVTRFETGWRLVYRDPGSKLAFVLELTDGDRGREAHLVHGGGEARATLPWSSTAELRQFELSP